jgi:hypothetical protein
VSFLFVLWIHLFCDWLLGQLSGRICEFLNIPWYVRSPGTYSAASAILQFRPWTHLQDTQETGDTEEYWKVLNKYKHMGDSPYQTAVQILSLWVHFTGCSLRLSSRKKSTRKDI